MPTATHGPDGKPWRSKTAAAVNQPVPASRALMAMRARRVVSPDTNWCVDSGATNHMSPNRHVFKDLCKLASPIDISIGDGNTIQATHVGTVTLHLTDGTTVTLSGCLYVPDIKRQLISVSTLAARNVRVTFNESGCSIIAPDTSSVHVPIDADGLYVIATTANAGSFCAVEPPSTKNELALTAALRNIDDDIASAADVNSALSFRDISNCNVQGTIDTQAEEAELAELISIALGTHPGAVATGLTDAQLEDWFISTRFGVVPTD